MGVTVIEDQAADDAADTGAAFAAGVAAATAANAAEEAQEAEEAAEAAQETAETAVDIAAAADEAAWDARIAVSDLEYRMTERFDRLEAALAGGAGPGDEAAPPAPERKEEPAEPAKEEPAEEKKTDSGGSRFGSRSWFG